MSAETTSLALSAEIEFSSVPCTSTLTSMLSVASIQAPLLELDETKRKGMDIIAVLDRSGSMSGEKMDMVHKTANLMIDNLTSRDRLCLVAYDDIIETPLRLTHMDSAGKHIARAAVKSITARNMTNLSGGLMQGCAFVNERQQPNEVCSVLLLTDGLANRGVTGPAELVQLTEKQVEGFKAPASIYTFGFGSDHNSELLTSIAKAGNGTYYFMHSVDTIPEAFADCLGGLMSVTAQNLQLTITTVPAVTINAIPSQYPTTVVRTGHEYTISIGDIFSEERKDIVVDTTLPATATADVFPMISFRLTYFNVIAGQQEACEIISALPRTAAGTENGETSNRVDEQRNRIATAAAMEQARTLADRGQLREARDMLQACHLQVAASTSAATPASAGLAQDLLQVQGRMTDEAEYRAQGSHKLMAKSRKHWAQREAEVDADELCQYSNTSKAAARSRFK